MIKDIKDIINQQQQKVNKFENQKVILTDEFKQLYLETMKLNSSSEIYFYDSFSIVKTSNNLKIYIPNQWFYLAYLGAPLTAELINYKNTITSGYKFNTQQDFKDFIINAKDGNLDNTIFDQMTKNLSSTERQYLKEFLTNYKSWGGGKTLERGDYFVSPILDLLNLVNVSSSYVADISYHLASYFELSKVSENDFFLLEDEAIEQVDHEKAFKEWIITNFKNSKSLLKYVNTLNRFIKKVNTELHEEEFTPIYLWADPIQFSNQFSIDRIMEIAALLEPNTAFIPNKGSGSELKTIYLKFLDWVKQLNKDVIQNSQIPVPNYSEKLLNAPRQYIYFGAPGTGKSYSLNKDSKLFNDNVMRTTFHPNMSYGNFVGTFKPFPIRVEKRDLNGNLIKENNELIFEDKITYNYVPGPLIKQLVNALLNPDSAYLLIIEELNRANVSAVFGDLFQLLDRNKENISEYPIAINEDLQRYFDFIYNKPENKLHAPRMKQQLINGLIFPKNFYIWTTMNSADQGVMPMDTAFKRRWEQRYFGIDDAWYANKEKFSLYKSIIYKDVAPNGYTAQKTISWNVLRRIINDILSDNPNIPEDKLLGPYFLSKNVLESTNEDVTESFKSKVLMYLFDDVVKLDRSLLFKNIERMRYSEVVRTFEERGLDLFGINNDIVSKYRAEEFNSDKTDNEEV